MSKKARVLVVMAMQSLLGALSDQLALTEEERDLQSKVGADLDSLISLYIYQKEEKQK